MARLQRQWGLKVGLRPPQWGWSEAEVKAYVERRNREAAPQAPIASVVWRIVSDTVVVPNG